MPASIDVGWWACRSCGRRHARLGSGAPARQRARREHQERLRRGPWRGVRTPSMFAAGGAEPPGRPDARSPRLVELKVSKGTTPSQLAAHVARMNDVEYAFVPPVRTLFARRAKARRRSARLAAMGTRCDSPRSRAGRGGIQERDQYHHRRRRQRHRHRSSRPEATRSPSTRISCAGRTRTSSGTARTSPASSPRPPATAWASRASAAERSSR